MQSRLNRIPDWNERAEASNYSATALAKRCDVTLRHLERYFLETRGRSPHAWLHELRQRKARELILGGSLVKETAARLGYSQVANFSRDFKRHHGVSPAVIERPSAKCRVLI